MSYSLPYYRDAGQLPGPLPDQNEIERATRILPKISDYGGRLVVIRDIYVVKYGPLVTENEGYALLFVEKRLNVTAPRLYAMYRNQDIPYIVMEYIPGISLGTAWPSLTEANKHSIVGQLRCIFDQMRALPSSGFYGSVNRGPVPHSFFSDYLARHLPLALQNNPPMFTHGDLYRENVLVRKVFNSVTNEEEYEVAALVDWETAGWYPSYWEYAHIFPLLQWSDD
ncbi:unnamed protein product [Penicillium glandicola]